LLVVLDVFTRYTIILFGLFGRRWRSVVLINLDPASAFLLPLGHWCRKLLFDSLGLLTTSVVLLFRRWWTRPSLVDVSSGIAFLVINGNKGCVVIFRWNVED
jgi:hypothetical protein